jgi:hypothetical protein
MSTPDHQLAVSARFLRRSFAFACVALLLLGSSTNAGTVLQFGQVSSTDIVTATDVAGVTTLSTTGNADGNNVSILVNITNFLGVPGVNIPAYETFVNVTSSAPAFSVGGSDYQAYTGTIEFTSAPGGLGANFLTATLFNVGANPASILSGTDGGDALTLSGSQPPAGLTLTSDFAMLGPPTSVGIGFSFINPSVSIAGDGSISSFTGQNAGTFSASIVPEPGTLCLASFAVVLGTLAYGKKRLKAQG